MKTANVNDRDDGRARLYSTAELAATAGVTARAVRFYETRGLLKPQRAGMTRVFNYADAARLALILRGKRLGFSLREIGDYLELYGVDPRHIEQLRHVIDKSRDRIAQLEGKMRDLQITIRELRDIEREAVAHLNATTGRPQLAHVSSSKPPSPSQRGHFSRETKQ